MREPEVFHAVPLASDVSLAAEQVPVILLFSPVFDLQVTWTRKPNLIIPNAPSGFYTEYQPP